MTKNGYSLYIEKWNPRAKRYINTCALCGCQGYSPTIDMEGFDDDSERRAIHYELVKTLSPLPLDDQGRCADCARCMDK
jgi:hypothetical protein